MVRSVNKQPLIWLALVLLVVSSCRKAVLEVSKVPNNTPKGAQLYITGSFNNWNPGDPNYVMRLNEATGAYEVELPIGFGNIEYKFTRGDWTTVETDACGGERPNRALSYDAEQFPSDTIVGWSDLNPENCNQVTIVVESVPTNTPKKDVLYLGGDINGWQCDQARFKFSKTKDGKWTLTIPRNGDKLEYKICRGSWESAEMNEAGSEPLQRELRFGEQDSVFVAIHSWSDLPLAPQFTKTIVIENLPANTPANSLLYLASSSNNWNPLDTKQQFVKLANGKRAITIRLSEEGVQYKVTRGGWPKVENNESYGEIENRLLTPKSKDTVYISVAAWADMAPSIVKLRKQAELIAPKKEAQTEAKRIVVPAPMPAPKALEKELDKRKKVFLIIDKLPEWASEEEVYLAGDFNDWDPGNANYIFKRLPNGKRYLLLRLTDFNQHEFKVTRGDWDTEAATISQKRLENAVIPEGFEDDTIHIKVDKWYDYTPRRKLVMVLFDVPDNTPDDAAIYLAGDFNNWNMNQEKYRFKQLPNGRHVLNINDFSRKYNYYKITRGSWDTEATNNRGRVPGNQPFTYIYQDTIKMRVDGWKDLLR